MRMVREGLTPGSRHDRPVQKPFMPRLCRRCTRGPDPSSGNRAGNVSRMWPNDRGRGIPCAALARTRLHVTEQPGPEAVTALLDPPGDPAPEQTGKPRRGSWWWVPGAITVITIASVIIVTLSQLHPSMLLTNTTTTGGDTGAHIAMPKFLETLLSHGHLTGWDPGWYDGFPLYTFYFTIPDLFIAIGGWVIPYGVRSRWARSWVGDASHLRLGLRSILPPAPAAPHPARGRNTALSLRLHVHHLRRQPVLDSRRRVCLFVQPLPGGLVPGPLRLCGPRGQVSGWAAVVLAGCVLSHIVPGMYALGGAVILTIVELLPTRWGITDAALRIWRNDEAAAPVPRTRTLWWAGSTVAIGLLLSGWWLVPFGLLHAYSSSMGYTNVEGWAQYFREADAWALVLAGLGAVAAVLTRSRSASPSPCSGSCRPRRSGRPAGQPLQRPPPAVVVHLRLPHGGLGLRDGLYRRCDSLAAGAGASMGGGDGGAPWSESPPPRRPWEEPRTPGEMASDAGRIMTPRRPPSAALGAGCRQRRRHRAARRHGRRGATFHRPGVVASRSAGPTRSRTGPTTTTRATRARPRTPSTNPSSKTMESVSKRYGCGREMWEYSSSEDRFGTPEALMLLPIWTNGCIDSMEGLLFESSTTTPYHFLNQAELSAGLPSRKWASRTVRWMSPSGWSTCNCSGSSTSWPRHPRSSRRRRSTLRCNWSPRPARGHTTTTVPSHTPRGHLPGEGLLARHPSGQRPGRPLGRQAGTIELARERHGRGPALSWYGDPGKRDVQPAQSGPPDWPRTPVTRFRPTVKHVGTTQVTAVTQTDSTVSFHVSRVGTPVLVKVSYFPNWHVTGGDGPWRVTPNLMVVVPTSHT